MDDPRPLDDEPPPILGTWRGVYIFVLCELACVIALFYWFTAAYRP
jgi:hypothetical protein